ncbi:DnaJ C-terminal domain-containing protein [Paraburkholderia sp. ZP32-5]|uniref:DnaJ C-terminal domain-containing protein n=1 Tax=Paraburkholderia sp. ZP32-5 TaxID=2883245 RepID=UPI001F1EA7FA|nr:DnaJ C-terminal domain-containing protein [Paraburkholderia sp. ZP32-5]
MNLDEYYKRLNLSRTASPSDVKRAYRRLRAKYHPDRNKGRETTVAPVFTRIQEAFEILTGKRAPPASPPPSASAWAERPSQPPRPDPHRNAPAMRGANCLIELFVPLEAAIHGGEIQANYPVKEPCHVCQERAAACTACNGSGVSATGKQCAACGGSGRPRSGDACPACLGTRSRVTMKSAAVTIPPGAWDGQRLVIEGGGHLGVNGGPAGDAICSVAIVCDAAFRRDGLNLACEIQVDFVTAILGGSYEATILGRAHQLAIPPNAQAGSKIRLAKQGLVDRNGSRGDLTLHLVLAMPAAASHLNGDERQRLRDMFADAELRSRRLVGGSR